MKAIVLSKEDFFKAERGLVNLLFTAGLEIFHVRKPSASHEEMQIFLSEIEPKYRNRIALHSHHSLANENGINRLHFPEKDRFNFKREEGIIYSTSFHDEESAKEHGGSFDYYFMSPICDSISKKG